MTKEKKTFAWDTILLIKEAGGPMFVRGTDIEVEWCPITKMFWEKQTMITLAAKGYTTDGVPVFLWAYGNYKYEVEVKKLNFSESEVFDASFNEAVNKFEDRAINGVEFF